MNWVVGILIALVVALGVWLSLTIGSIDIPQESAASATTTTATYAEYTDPDGRFSVRYPAGYTVEATGANTILKVNPQIAAGTNLATDSGVILEVIPPGQGGGPECSAGRFFDQGTSNYGQEITQNGVVYSFASNTGAAAGNRYDEYVYALKGSSPCVGVRYFIHYGVIENYPKGTTTNFDREALLRQFDSIRESLTLQ